MIVERLVFHHYYDDELWHLVEAAWANLAVHVIKSLYDSMLRRITAVIAAGGVCFRY